MFDVYTNYGYKKHKCLMFMCKKAK